MKKLYIGNLPWSATEDELRALFAEFGSVESVAIITDRETGRSRGFGFIEIASAEGALKAVAQLDGRDFGGRALRVNEAQDKGGGAGGGGGRGEGGGR